MASRTLAPMLALALLVPALLVVPSGGAAGAYAWGSDLSPWWSYDPATRVPALDTAKATGMTHVVTDAKDGWGLAAWATPSYATFTPLASGDGATERIVRDAQARGISVIARFDAFEDHQMAKSYPYAALGGSPSWVDPACPDVRAKLIQMARDLVVRTGVSEVNLDHVRYPDTNELPASTPLPCTGGRLGDAPGTKRVEVITSFVRDASAAIRAAKPGVTVSASVFAGTMKGAMPHIGQDAALLAPHLDVLMPMAYPSYYSSAAEADPYNTVKQTTAAGVARFGAAKVRPWVQGFGPYAGSGEKVCAQLKAAADAGATGAFVWWFPSMGTASAPWKAAAACIPGTTAPAPAPTTFTATFSPKPGNAWWVETSVGASGGALARVSASVDGGAPVDLPRTSWGTWAKSFHVPEGARVRFTAHSTEGAVVQSAMAYVWPSATPVDPAAPAPSPSPGTAFKAEFAKVAATKRWMEVRVSANLPVASVTASVDGGTPFALAKTSSGTWGKNARVPEDAKVVFVAQSTDGQRVTSAAMAWR